MWEITCQIGFIVKTMIEKVTVGTSYSIYDLTIAYMSYQFVQSILGSS